MREQGMFDPARLVFIDETCTNTALVRLRGRAPRGERLVGYAPHGHWKTITFVGGLRQRGMTAPFVLEGAMNGPMFLAYVKQCLVPTLKRGEIVLMDHLPVHKVAGIAEAIEAVASLPISARKNAGTSFAMPAMLEHELRPGRPTTFPLARAADAHRLLASRRSTGALVMLP
jgi:transposase